MNKSLRWKFTEFYIWLMVDVFGNNKRVYEILRIIWCKIPMKWKWM